MIMESLRAAFDTCTGWVSNLNAALGPYTNWYFSQIHDLLPEPFFNTQAFLIFFGFVFAIYWLIPRRWQMTRIWFLVFSSFHFYAAWSKDLAFLITSTTFADYCFGRLMVASQRKKFRLAVVLASISMNLGVLYYFKYRGFFLNELYDSLVLLGYDPGYGKLNIANIMIPFGISFYTFVAISYAVDVYRGKIPAEKNLARFMLFILFFPHLVSGPIVRAGDFLHQTHKPKRWNWLRIQVGVQLFLLGVFKKMAIADRMAVFCDPVFANPTDYSAAACWISLLAQGVRVYCDFSGYSDMAIGLAHLFGYKLLNNFNMPYLAENISEFWRRWHISLSNWLRDYVLIPMGGSRGNRWLTDSRLFATMLFGGLWHGAAWGFIMFVGVAHGLMLIIHRHFRFYCKTKPRLDAALRTPLGTALRIMFTFFCFNMFWPLFQADLGKGLEMYRKMFSFSSGKPLPLSTHSLWYTAAFVAICHLLVRFKVWQRFYVRLPAPILGAGYAMCASLAMLMTPEKGTVFVYFQF
ncbi:MAG TPA: MBOAT family O-acyltransferase [Gemmata sp.]|nr:MBOAT family O-acyltransferase [Gemmata sp.]